MTPVQFSALFTSVDEMAEKTGFDFDFCQLERGEPILKTSTTILPSVFSTTFYFNKRFHQKGKAPEGYVSVGIMLGDSRTRNTGKNYGSEHLFDFNSRSGYETVSDGPFLAKSIHVNVDRLHDTADLHDINLSGMGKIDYAMPRLVDPTKIQQLQDTIRNMEYLVSPMNYQLQEKERHEDPQNEKG